VNINPFDSVIDVTRRVQRLERQQPNHPRASSKRSKWGLFAIPGTLTCGAAPDVTYVDWGPEEDLPGGWVRGDAMPDGNYTIRSVPNALWAADFWFEFDTGGWVHDPADTVFCNGWDAAHPTGLELVAAYQTMNISTMPSTVELPLTVGCSHNGLDTTGDVYVILRRIDSGGVELHLTPEGDL